MCRVLSLTDHAVFSFVARSRRAFLTFFAATVALGAIAQPLPDPVPREMLRSIDAGHVLFVEHSGNDSTAVIGDQAHPWKTPLAAVAAANLTYANEPIELEILIGPGTFNLGQNPLWPTNGMIISGSGPDETMLMYFGDEHTNGPAIMFSDKQLVRNLKVVCIQPTGEPLDQTCVGALSDSPNKSYYGTNYIYNCNLIAGAHGIQLNPSGTTQPCRVMCWNCSFNSPNAPAQVLVPHGTIEIHNFYAESEGPEPAGRSFNCGFENFSGTLILKNGTISVKGSYDAQYVLGLTSGYLPNSFINGAVTNILDNIVFDITAESTNPAVVVDVGVEGFRIPPVTKLNNCSHIDGSPVTVATTSNAIVSVTYSLNIVQQSTNTFLSWPTSAVGYALEETADLSAPWTASPLERTTNGLWITATSPVGGSRFFRLKGQ